MFDKDWYLKNNPDVVASRLDPIKHYVLYGAFERRDPSPSFSVSRYLSHNPDIAAAGVNPLEHFIVCGAQEGRLGGPTATSDTPSDPTLPSSPVPIATPTRVMSRLENLAGVKSYAPNGYSLTKELQADCALLRESGLLDPEWYRARAGIGSDIDTVEHYLLTGWRLGLEPAPTFKGELLYPYFQSAGYSRPPAITYLQLRAAGKPAYSSLADAEDWAALIRESDLFDAPGYAARIGHIDGLDPALHYVVVGEHMGYAPSDGFDPSYYWERYPDIARAPVSCLGHYLKHGRLEGRRPVSIAAELFFDCSRIDHNRHTVLLISHEASRTGAPILAYNVAKRLSNRYNVVTLLLGGGELIPNFQEISAAVIGPLSHADWHPVEADRIVRRLIRSYRVTYAIGNSTETRLFAPALAIAFIPVVALIHEFASYTRPQGALGEGLDWSTQIVFSTNLTATSAINEHPRLSQRQIHILPQGQCEVPHGARATANDPRLPLGDVLRPKGSENALVVLGAGFVHIRKGVDLFLSCAAAITALETKRPVRFVWIGNGYDVVNDPGYSVYLNEQIALSRIEARVAIINAVQDLEPAYRMSDVFFLSSRLDSLPNVAIDAAFSKLPIVCFEGSSGMASMLNAEDQLRFCVVPHLDVHAAARVIADLANDETERLRLGDAFYNFAKATFDMDHYVQQLDTLGHAGIDIMTQRKKDFITIAEDSLFDNNIFLPPAATVSSREQAIRQFLTLWPAIRTSAGAGKVFHFRRPCAGFNPQIYAHENSGRFDSSTINPLAHFIRSGKPEGPWHHEVITPSVYPNGICELRTALHVHFYYPELVSDFLKKIDFNRSRCDLLLTTDTEEKADALDLSTAGYARGKVRIDVVPNRGRDIGALLSGLKNLVDQYEIIGHLHSKRSLFSVNTADPTLGDRWREFLWQNLLGGRHPMMDVILNRFALDDHLGIVFAEDTHFSDWDGNLEIATDLAKRIGMQKALPPFFDFPVGTMFWARANALRPMFDLKLDWNDYPQEPLPFDGSILRALERLLPFVARDVGYCFATTNVPGITR